MLASYLIYGANGYTGELLAREAHARGHTPILAGRREAALRPLAEELGGTWRSFALDDPRALDAGLAGAAAVLHCAGPFSKTSQPMAEACLRNGIHYLDVTGELAVFEALAARDAQAKQARVTLLPGVGFDVVPSDCLAVHLKRRLPDATTLRLGFQTRMAMSRGTATTTIEGFGKPNIVRRAGVLCELPTGSLTREIDFGDGPVKAVSIPWGDVSTAYYSTGIGTIEVYVNLPMSLRLGMRLSGLLGPLMQGSRVQSWLKQRVRRGPSGPDASARAAGYARLWGEACNSDGRSVSSRLRTPDGYSLTVETALACVERIVRGEGRIGFQTPGKLFGADFILQMPGVRRLDT